MQPICIEVDAAEIDIGAILKMHQHWLADKRLGKRAEFVDATLNDADFRPAGGDSGSSWDGAVFDRSTMIEANFTGCSLVGASFSQSHLERASLTDSDLSGANLTEAHLDFVCPFKHGESLWIPVKPVCRAHRKTVHKQSRPSGRAFDNQAWLRRSRSNYRLRQRAGR